MKDARGHGSSGGVSPGRGTGSGIFGRNGVGIASNAQFSRNPKQWQAESDTQRTVNRMRDQLRSTPSAGHAGLLSRAIKLFTGNGS